MGQETAPPRLLDSLDQLPQELFSGRLGLAADFDGTLAEFVDVPADAAISPAAAEWLRKLTDSIALVAVVSGRAVADLQERVGIPSVTYVGNHGVEYVRDGTLEIAPGAEAYRDRLRRLLANVRGTEIGREVLWEDKGYSFSGHYRQATDHDATRRRLEKAVLAAPGVGEMDVFWGNMVLEVRTPLGLDKGYALERLVELHGLDSVIVIGDDRTDADAWRALSRMNAEGRAVGMSVAVRHPGSPPELLQEADYRLDGVGEVALLLAYLYETVSAR